MVRSILAGSLAILLGGAALAERPAPHAAGPSAYAAPRAGPDLFQTRYSLRGDVSVLGIGLGGITGHLGGGNVDLMFNEGGFFERRLSGTYAGGEVHLRYGPIKSFVAGYSSRSFPVFLDGTFNGSYASLIKRTPKRVGRVEIEFVGKPKAEGACYRSHVKIVIDNETLTSGEGPKSSVLLCPVAETYAQKRSD